VRILVETDLEVPMRDGVALAADVYRPDDGGRHATLILRLPYDKWDVNVLNFPFDVLRGVRAGYAVVAQDTRGRFRSGGEFKPFHAEDRDGADTIAWAAAQPWSNGQVGMAGASYFGATQWLAASQSPPALRAIAPLITSAEYYEEWAYQGGAFQLGFNLTWALSLATAEANRRAALGVGSAAEVDRLARASDRTSELFERLPLQGLNELARHAPYYAEWLSHPSYDEFWRATAPRERYAQIVVPALNMGGWYDIFLKGTLANYVGMKTHGGSEAARRGQRLLIGPWAHGNLSGTFPERSFGQAASLEAADLTGLQLRWFDGLLAGEQPGLATEKPVRIFVMGHNSWRDEDDWPLPGTRFTDYFLRSRGHANTAAGDGVLSLEPPGEEPEDVYLYDPHEPVPTLGGPTFLPGLLVSANAGPRDQRRLEGRADVLCYTTEPLERPLEVIGPLELVLYVSSSAPDTDFTGKLVEVWPNGRAECLTDGIMRARYRGSASQPALLEPGAVVELRVDLVATANVFAAGNRVRLEVSSSNFPRFDRNTNTGAVIADDAAGELRQTVNRVDHCAAGPSRLILPLTGG
jgi:putative CocE/NonD family hydrolase